MISPSTAATAVSSGISLVLLWILVFWFYRNYRIDLFRERMFMLRQELFNLALDGGLEFDHAAYGLTRTTLNGFIRFGHRVSFSMFAVTGWAMKGKHAPEELFAPRFAEAVATLPPETKARVETIVQRMHLFAAEQMIVSSPLFMVFMLPALVALLAKHEVTRISRRLLDREWVRRRWLDPIDAVAFEMGSSGQALPVAA